MSDLSIPPGARGETFARSLSIAPLGAEALGAYPPPPEGARWYVARGETTMGYRFETVVCISDELLSDQPALRVATEIALRRAMVRLLGA